MTQTATNTCPRCDSGLVPLYDELKCMYCGFVDYNSVPDFESRVPNPVITTIPYGGGNTRLNGIRVKVQAVPSDLAFPSVDIFCPWCDKVMEDTRAGGIGVRVKAYECAKFHRVRVYRLTEEEWYWL
jgi:hypothetical protein